MGWVMVGESLLSAGVIAPRVGADFLSTGICRASLGPVAPSYLTLAGNTTIDPQEKERITEIIHEMRA